MISLLQAPAYRAYPNVYLPAAFESALRLQNGCYIPRWELAPQDGNLPIPARGYVSQVVRFLPGTFILAIEMPVGLCQITDLGSGLTFFDQPASAPGFLPLPRLVSEPGELKVEIWSLFTTAETWRMLISAAEPAAEVVTR